MYKRLVTFAASALLLAADQNVKLTFYSYNLASAGIGADGTKQLISEFEALHPNITVDGVGIPSTGIMSRPQANLADRSSEQRQRSVCPDQRRL